MIFGPPVVLAAVAFLLGRRGLGGPAEAVLMTVTLVAAVGLFVTRDGLSSPGERYVAPIMWGWIAVSATCATMAAAAGSWTRDRGKRRRAREG